MKCSLFDSHRCRSCELLEHTYSESLALKQAHLEELLSPLTGPGFDYKPAVGVKDDAAQTRGKAKFAVYRRSGKIEFGFFNSDASTQKQEDCPLYLDGINALIPPIKNAIEAQGLEPYDVASRKGDLKYVLITKSDTVNEFLVRFVVRSKDCLPRLRTLFKNLQASHPDVTVCTANIQPIHQAVIEGDEEIVLSEKSVIHHKFGEFDLTLGPRSFFQVTPVIARKLYSAFENELSQKPAKSLLDLYCGVGAFSFYGSKHAKKVTGIEISKEAIECAKVSQKINGTGNIEFHCLDVEAFLSDNPAGFDAVIVNPPRRGLNPNIISTLKRMSPERIYYSSCNAETLARDIGLLPGYHIASAQIFDMFPYTKHFETLVVLDQA